MYHGIRATTKKALEMSSAHKSKSKTTKRGLSKGKEFEREIENAMEDAPRVKFDIDLGLTSVLSVRMPKTMLAELTKAAKEIDVAPATFARQAIAEKIAMSDAATATQLAQVVARLVEKIEKLPRDPGAA